MEFDRLRRSLEPLFGLERRDSVEKLLTFTLYAAIGANALYSVFHLFAEAGFYGGTGVLYFSLLIFHVMLLAVLKRGYLNQAALALLFSSWAVLTYQAWAAAGVHDTALAVYILLIMVSALITSWRVSIVLSLLSIIVLWGLAVAERLELRAAALPSPLSVAVEMTIIFVLVVLLIFLVVDALRRSVDAVKEGEERFRKIFQVSPAAISITSLHDGRLLEANGAYWKLTGFSPEKSIGRTTIELMIWKNEADRQIFVQKLIERRSLHNPAYELVNNKGEKRITAVFYELMDHGVEPAILSMFYDITEQITAQRALHRSEERFRRVFEVSPVAIVITTLDEGRIIDANAAYWQLSGHDPETSIGATTLELRPGLRPEFREQFVRELLESRSIQYPSYDFMNELGDRLKTVAFFELIDVDGKSAILSMFYDMTQQNRARDALRQSETRLRAMLEAVPDMILEIQQDGTIVHFIPSANNEFDYSAEKMVGKTIAQVLPAIAEQTAFGIRRALDSGQVYAFEFEYVGALDGDNKTFEARITPAGPDLVLALVRDVSLNKWSESERENLIEELEQKNAELERFTYTVSHDLKSPLITIKGFLGFVREDAKAGDIVRLEKDIQRINDATEKMQQLLSDLLELSRVGRINNTPVQILTNELIAEVVELLQGRISAGKISVHIADDLPSIYGDRPRIFEVFQNLIDNAAKFMGDQPEPRIDIGVQGEFNGAPIFFVRDNGIGIAAQFKDRIFGLFDKLNAESEGTGIGLALVKRIVEFHGGRIWVESQVGMGTSFYFVFQTQPPLI
jgi:PAS domain S-box-containing protein